MTVLDDEPKTKTVPHTDRGAELALLFATMVWGSSFTWAKSAGDTINRLSGAGAGASVGPTMLMAARFIVAALVWFVIFPGSRRGWSLTSVYRGAALGLVMGAGLALQVLGLDRTSEAVSAFLTSLTILWVPMIMTLAVKKSPPGVFWIGVALAGAGIWLMTGAMPAGFGVGEMLGLACSVAFSFQIILTNILVPRDNPDRMNGAQMMVAGLCAVAVCLLTPAGRGALLPASAFRILLDPGVVQNLILLVIFPTVISFGIMIHYQPRVDPSRATLIYLTEPIFAGAYAWIFAGKALTAVELFGAFLILAANAVVELLMARKRSVTAP